MQLNSDYLAVFNKDFIECEFCREVPIIIYLTEWTLIAGNSTGQAYYCRECINKHTN